MLILSMWLSVMQIPWCELYHTKGFDMITQSRACPYGSQWRRFRSNTQRIASRREKNLFVGNLYVFPHCPCPSTTRAAFPPPLVITSIRADGSGYKLYHVTLHTVIVTDPTPQRDADYVTNVLRKRQAVTE